MHNTLPATGEAEAFRHQPLDQSKAAIRLIKILPDRSQDGLIQCVVIHATTTASYTCLSYRWGEYDPSTSATILMNGAPFIVRQNLRGFLTTMQASFARPDSDLALQAQCSYWIDALCINQSNTSERNHQVVQMGSVFSMAERVHIFLGKMPTAASLNYVLKEPKTEPIFTEWMRLQYPYNYLVARYFFRNGYWDRAWITQEIMQAKAIQVSVGTQLLTLQELCDSVRKFSDDWEDTHYRGFRQFAAPDRLLGRFPVRDLATLMSHFRRKECSVPRDRVFSLLSLSRDGGRVDVDYESPAVELAVQVLGFHPWKVSICSAAVVSASLELPPNTLEPWLEIDVAGLCVTKNSLRNTDRWHTDEPNFCLTHPKTSTTWAYDSWSPIKIRLPQCLEDTLGYFSRHILRDEILANKFMRLYDPMRIPTLSEMVGQERLERAGWRLLNREKTIQIIVIDLERNICTFRMPLQAASQILSDTVELCPNPKPWYQDGNDGVVRAVRMVHNGHRISDAITPPRTPPTLPS